VPTRETCRVGHSKMFKKEQAYGLSPSGREIGNTYGPLIKDRQRSGGTYCACGWLLKMVRGCGGHNQLWALDLPDSFSAQAPHTQAHRHTLTHSHTELSGCDGGAGDGSPTSTQLERRAGLIMLKQGSNRRGHMQPFAMGIEHLMQWAWNRKVSRHWLHEKHQWAAEKLLAARRQKLAPWQINFIRDLGGEGSRRDWTDSEPRDGKNGFSGNLLCTRVYLPRARRAWEIACMAAWICFGLGSRPIQCQSDDCLQMSSVSAALILAAAIQPRLYSRNMIPITFQVPTHLST
jgi:hypothetical protein